MSKVATLWLVAGLFLPSLLWSQKFLTQGEIYDFSSGDEFHFLHFPCCNQDYFQMEQIRILERVDQLNKVQYIRQHNHFTFLHGDPPILSDTNLFEHIDTLVYENLDWIPFDDEDASFQDPEIFHNRIINTDHFFITNTFGKARYAEGLGKVYLAWRTPPSTMWVLADSLCHYKKGTESWGSTLLHDHENKSPGSVSLFPNPVIHALFISVPTANGNSGTGTASIFNLQGQLILTQAFETTPGEIMRIQCGNLPPGLYFLYFSTEEKSGTGKFIKQ